MERALCAASEVPLEIMETILETMDWLKILGAKGSRLAVSDVGVAILFGQAALEGASLNVLINTKMMKNQGFLLKILFLFSLQKKHNVIK